MLIVLKNKYEVKGQQIFKFSLKAKAVASGMLASELTFLQKIEPLSERKEHVLNLSDQLYIYKQLLTPLCANFRPINSPNKFDYSIFD